MAPTRARVLSALGKRKFSSWKQNTALPPTACASMAISRPTSSGERRRSRRPVTPCARPSRWTLVMEQKLHADQHPRLPLTGMKGMPSCRECRR